MSTALSAIGGAIDRATLALLWLGRGVFVFAAICAGIYAADAAYKWWSTPTIQLITDPKLIAHLGAEPGRTYEIQEPDGAIYEVKASELQTAVMIAQAKNIEKHRARAKEQLGVALASLLAGAIFLGLMRVTRWIVTGR